MGNTVSEAQKNTAQNFVQPNDANNNNNAGASPKNPHSYAKTSGMTPPPECPMHVKVEEKKDAGCAVAGAPDKINPLNMVSVTTNARGTR